MAASIAWVSKGFRFLSPERSRRLEPSSMRFSTAASGTSLTRTQIFTGMLLLEFSWRAAEVGARDGRDSIHLID
jgi:hypothetical protein